jgi:hypothetical protein
MITAEGKPIPGVQDEPAASTPYIAFLRGNHIGMHATVTYRRRALEAVGGFNTKLPACEDYDLYLRISKRFPVAMHEQLVAEYRMHSSNMSRDPVRMLDAATHVLGLQRDQVAGHPDQKAALENGLKHWKDHYTELMLEGLGETWRKSGGIAKVSRLLGFFLARAPLTVVRLSCRRFALRLGKVRRRFAQAPSRGEYHQ